MQRLQWAGAPLTCVVVTVASMALDDHAATTFPGKSADAKISVLRDLKDVSISDGAPGAKALAALWGPDLIPFIRGQMVRSTLRFDALLRPECSPAWVFGGGDGKIKARRKWVIDDARSHDGLQVIGWGLTGVFDVNSQSDDAIFARFRENDFLKLGDDVGAQLSFGGPFRALDDIARSGPQENCREGENDSEGCNGGFRILLDKAPDAVTIGTAHQEELGNTFLKLLAGGLLLFFAYAMLKRL